MRSRWLHGVTVAASLLLALVMLLINIAMEAVGSIPDIEACSFLAGSLLALWILYPLTAGLIAARAARTLLRRFPEDDTRLAVTGARIGLCGAFLYFLTGLLIMAGPIHPVVVGLVLLYTVSSALGGAVGAFLTAEKMRYMVWRSSQN